MFQSEGMNAIFLEQFSMFVQQTGSNIQEEALNCYIFFQIHNTKEALVPSDDFGCTFQKDSSFIIRCIWFHSRTELNWKKREIFLTFNFSCCLVLCLVSSSRVWLLLYNLPGFSAFRREDTVRLWKVLLSWSWHYNTIQPGYLTWANLSKKYFWPTDFLYKL